MEAASLAKPGTLFQVHALLPFPKDFGPGIRLLASSPQAGESARVLKCDHL